MKNDYDDVFRQSFLEDDEFGLSVNKDYAKIKNLVDDLGFFGFMQSGKFRDLTATKRCFTKVLRQLVVSQPEIATQVLENEIAAIGFTGLHVLVERLGIDYNPKKMYRSLDAWIDRYEKEREVARVASSSTKIKYGFSIELGGRIPKIYSDLIFAAESHYQRYVIQRLFEVCPMKRGVHQALALCKENNPEALFLVAVQPDDLNRRSLAELITNLGLENRLDEEKVQRYWKAAGKTDQSNDVLAKFTTTGLREKVAGNLSQGLLFGDIETETPAAVLYNQMLKYLESLETRGAQSSWLMCLAEDFRGAFKRASYMAPVNHLTGKLMVNLMIKHAAHDEGPLKTLLSQIDSNDPDQGMQNALRTMLFEACFAKPAKLHRDRFDRCYGPSSLQCLANDGVLEQDQEKYFWKPMLASHMLETARKAYAEVIVGVLIDEPFRIEERIKITEDVAQAIVDARMLTRRHWRMISENESAAAIMSKARLSPGILAIVGERMQEMTFGADMGL